MGEGECLHNSRSISSTGRGDGMWALCVLFCCFAIVSEFDSSSVVLLPSKLVILVALLLVGVEVVDV